MFNLFEYHIHGSRNRLRSQNVFSLYSFAGARPLSQDFFPHRDSRDFYLPRKDCLFAPWGERGLLLLKQRLLWPNIYTNLPITFFETSEEKVKEALLRVVNTIRGLGLKIIRKQT